MWHKGVDTRGALRGSAPPPSRFGTCGTCDLWNMFMHKHITGSPPSKGHHSLGYEYNYHLKILTVPYMLGSLPKLSPLTFQLVSTPVTLSSLTLSLRETDYSCMLVYV